MKALRRMFLRLTGSMTRRRDEARLRTEIDEHLAQQTAANLHAGMSAEEAQRQAVLKFGAVEAIKDDYRSQQTLPFFEELLRNLRYAMRTLRRNPTFAAVAILTLALGVGANTAMFAVVNAVLLKPLPFNDPERLMLVHLRAPGDGLQTGTHRETVWSYPKYRTFLDLQQTFEDNALFGGRDLSLSGDNAPESVRAEVVTDRYPGVLGIRPTLGRPFTDAEANRAGEPPVALISHALWSRLYGADSMTVGRQIHLNRMPHTIVGVLPPGFRGLTGTADVWVPLAVNQPTSLTQRQGHAYYLVARRKREVSETQAIAAAEVVGAQIANEYSNKEWGASAASLYSSRVDDDLRRAALVLLGVVALVLLIACVNLTNLLIAKALGRRSEVAVRAAIGASRVQIARQFIAEGILLAGVGSALGIVVATFLLDAARVLLPDADVFFRAPIAPGTQRIFGATGLARVGASMISLDGVTLLFTGVVAAVVSVLIALVPAWQSASLKTVDALKARGVTTAGFPRFSARNVLVSVQIALAVVLLAGAGLLIKSAAQLHATRIGVAPNGVYTFRLDLPAGALGGGYTPQTRAVFVEQLTERLRAIPGVASVGAANCAPLSGACSSTLLDFGRTRQTRPGMPGIGVHWVTSGYFSTLGIQLRRGRFFTDRDRADQPKVVLVNEAAVRAYWPNADPIGTIITLGMGGFETGAEIVGVVSDVRHAAIESAPVPDAYIPYLQAPIAIMRVFIRSQSDQANLMAPVRHEVRQLDPNLPLTEVKTMDERVGDAMWRTRVASWFLSAFSGLALLLTAIGIFGVMSQTVSQRSSEIGIRIALGAESRDVLGLVLGRATLLAVVGIGFGLVLAVVLTRLMTIMLYQVQPGDPTTLAIVAFILGAVAMSACYLPARRAARVDPMVALRYE
jgi:putative ABC transport system permease protein